MNALPPDGIWSSPSVNYPGQLEFMAIDPERQRIVTFVVTSINPVKRAPMPVWYEQGAPGTIRVRLKPTSEWKSHDYKIDGAIIYWIQYADKYPWTRVSSEDIPEWLDDRLHKVYTRMDIQQNEAEQGAAANR